MRLLPLVSAIACVRGFLPPAARCAPPALRADANDYERVQQTEEADMIADWEARQARRDGAIASWERRGALSLRRRLLRSRGSAMS